jgi:nucleoside-diphosphate-sugar epimerase
MAARPIAKSKMTDILATDVLIVGCGDLGLEVARLLLATKLKVLGVRRKALDTEKLPIIAGDVTQPATLKQLAQTQAKYLVYCVAASEQSDENYQQIYVQGLKNTLAALANNAQLQHVFFVSSTRMYGQVSDALLDESVVAEPNDFGGVRLLEAEQYLHQAAVASHQWKSTALRLTGIYGPGRMRMMQLAQDLNRWPLHNTWTNRIHRDDAAAFIVFLMTQLMAKKTLDECYIVTDSCPVSMFEVLAWIAQKSGLPAKEIQPATSGKRMSNQRMLATGFKLQYPDYKKGYQSLIDLPGIQCS